MKCSTIADDVDLMIQRQSLLFAAASIGPPVSISPELPYTVTKPVQ